MNDTPQFAVTGDKKNRTAVRTSWWVTLAISSGTQPAPSHISQPAGTKSTSASTLSPTGRSLQTEFLARNIILISKYLIACMWLAEALWRSSIYSWAHSRFMYWPNSYVKPILTTIATI